MWYDNLKRMKVKSGLTTKEVAIRSNVPEATLEKLFAGTTHDPRLMTVWRVVHTLGYTLNDLDDADNKKMAPSLSDGALQLAKDYDSLDDHGQRMIEIVVAEEQARLDAQNSADKPPAPPPTSPAPEPEPEPEPDYRSMPFAAYGGADKETFDEAEQADIEMFQRMVDERKRQKDK